MQLKGNAFITALKVWQEVLTADEWREVYDGLPQATKDMVAHPPLAMAWIDAKLSNAIGARVATLFGQRGLELCEQVGARTLDHDLRTIYKVLMRVSTIDFVTSKAAQMYDTYVIDVGSLHVDRTSANTIVAHYTNLVDFNDSNQWFLCGTVAGVMRLAGAKDLRVTTRERTATGFDFHYEWKG